MITLLIVGAASDSGLNESVFHEYLSYKDQFLGIFLLFLVLSYL